MAEPRQSPRPKAAPDGEDERLRERIDAIDAAILECLDE
jgi:hypothetical protein